jgi:hypothetical protein
MSKQLYNYGTAILAGFEHLLETDPKAFCDRTRVMEPVVCW